MEKIVGYKSLDLFFTKLKKWLELNFESLFKNDEDLERRLLQLEQFNADLLARIENLESTDFTTENIDDDIDYDNI